MVPYWCLIVPHNLAQFPCDLQTVGDLKFDLQVTQGQIRNSAVGFNMKNSC